MYLSPQENARMLSIIRDNFDNATVFLECIARKWVNQEKIEESIQKTGSKFIFGADSFDDLKDIAIGYRKIKDDDITRGMATLFPIITHFHGFRISIRFPGKYF